jgi:hypothetical protein
VRWIEREAPTTQPHTPCPYLRRFALPFLPKTSLFEASPTRDVRISGEGLNHGTQLNFDDAGVRRLGAGQQDDFCHVLRVKHP